MTGPASSSGALGRTLGPGPSLAEMAALEFQRRRATATRKVAEAKMLPGDANGLLLPWLALACRAGADLPEYREALAELRANPFYTDSLARAACADEICPLPQIRAALADARDAKIDEADGRQDPALDDRARRLAVLAMAFGAPPYLPASARSERRAA